MDEVTLDELIARIKEGDEKVRTDAWLSAGKFGASAVKPLAAVMTHEEIEIARAAKRGLWKIVRHVGRPGADDERRPVVDELLGLLGNDQPVAVRREVLWMLSEIGGNGNKPAGPMGRLLRDAELREDARCCLQRLPAGGCPTVALEEALETVPDDFKPAIAQSLRVRGVAVSEEKYPTEKLVPTKQTQVKPLGR